MTEGFASADGVRIHWIDHEGSGEDLLLVHATGFHAHVWDPFLPELTTGFRVVTLDQRGHGDSDKPDSGYEWENFGRDVLAVVDHLSLQRPAAAGHSAGAAALVLAETSRPGTFSRLALMDPVLPDPQLKPFMTGSANPMVDQARKRRATWETRDQMFDRLKERSPLQGWRDEFLRDYVEHGTRPLPDGGYELKCPPSIEAQVYENNGRHDGWERVPDLTCPALLLLGEHSNLWPAGRREPLIERLPGGRFVVVEQGGHFFPMERPDETMRALLDFL